MEKKDKVMHIEIGKPFEDKLFEQTRVFVHIDLTYLIDWHDYHDAPNSVEFTASKEELQKLVTILQDRINKM